MRHLRTVLRPLGGVTGVFVYPVLIPHSYQPHPNQFSCLLQNTLWKDQESPQNELVIGKKYPKILHGTVVNGVQDRQSVYYFANAQFVNPEVRMFVIWAWPK